MAQFLLWRHRQAFGTSDPYFHKDIGFYVFDLPWLHYLVDFGHGAAVLSAAGRGGRALPVRRHPAAVASGNRLSGAAQVQISVLLGLFVLLKAADYWLDRFDLTTQAGGLFTGHELHRATTPCCRRRTS